MNKSKVSYGVLSDIHLGHRLIATQYIIANLLAYFKTNHNILKKLDILFIAGDLYDRLLSTNSDDYALINEWLSLLVMYCNKHNIKLRVLEGTPSHDWKQIVSFNTTIATLNVEVDYKYIDALSIEYIDDLGISVLYVPDEWNHNAEDTLIEVKALLKQHNLDQVDIAIMHGQFHHQLPMITLDSSHDEESYLSLVKYYINIGHIHISSVYKRILAQGSFDRLAHNEEGDKGGMVMTIYHTGDMEFLFLKNKNAYPFKKYDVSDLNTSEIVGYLTKELRKLKLGTRVKVIVASNEVNKLLKPLQDKFKDMIFTVDKKKVKLTPVIKDNKIVITPFEIHKDNIEKLLLGEVDKYDLSTDDLALVTEELQAVI